MWQPIQIEFMNSTAVSTEEPEYTANSDALGALAILAAIRILGLEKKKVLSVSA
jgi:GDP-D-mannose dehydratase